MDGTVYAQLPFTTGYSVVDPPTFGFGDPGALLDPDTGISQLLRGAEPRSWVRRSGSSGEVVREVTGDAARRRSCRRSSPARTRASRCTPGSPSPPSSGQLRRAVLTGPFFTATAGRAPSRSS